LRKPNHFFEIGKGIVRQEGNELHRDMVVMEIGHRVD